LFRERRSLKAVDYYPAFRSCTQSGHRCIGSSENPKQKLMQQHRKGTICMSFKITVLPGDGIGPEVCREAVNILRAVNGFQHREFQIEEKLIGGAAIHATGTALPESTLRACLESDAVLLGAVGAPEFDHL